MKKIIKKAFKYARLQTKRFSRSIGVLPIPVHFSEKDIKDAYIAGAVNFNGEVDESPDWEQRRYEIAKDCLAGIFPNTQKASDVYESKKYSAVWQAVDYADELIKKLKGGRR